MPNVSAGLEALAGFAGLEALAGEEVPLLPAKASNPACRAVPAKDLQ